jgi:SPP1 family predicted phage head-tail adaptor
MPSLPEWPRLNPSDLRHNIQIQSQSTTRDDAGQQVDNWPTVLTTRAKIEAVNKNERYQAGQLTSQVTHVITMRWPNVRVTAGMRVLFGSHVYTIQAPENVGERNIILQLLVLELNGAA